MPPEGVAESLAEESLRRLGRYRVERLIGAGRSGAVFLGRDPILGRPVALTVLPLRAGVRSAEREERLELLGETFRHLGGLSHPSLSALHDAGIEEENAYLVMEFVLGQDLEATLSEGPLSTERVLEVGRELAAGLDYAHARGVVHGDLRPGSVMLQQSATAKLVDFGIASALAASRLSHALSLWDEPTYLAPETLTGPPGPPGDQYALALLLYRALTGGLPYTGQDPFALLEQIEHAAPRPPSALDPRLPAAVDLCFQRALDKQPEARFTNCRELVHALADALQSQAAPSPPVFATQPLDENVRRSLAGTPLGPRAVELPRGRRRRWSVALLAAGAAAGLGLGAAVVLSRDGEARNAGPVRAPSSLGVAAPAPSDSDLPEAIFAPPPPPGLERPREGLPPATAPPPPSPAPGRSPTAARLDPAPSPDVPSYGTLRVRLITEGPPGRLTVLMDDELVLDERFQFGGPVAFLRRRLRAGQLERVRQVPTRPATLSVRVELGDRIQVIPLRAAWDEDLELTLEAHVGLDRSVTATLR